MGSSASQACARRWSDNASAEFLLRMHGHDSSPTREQVLRRIREEIDARRAAGEKLPAPPKTAIAGPEYFGFNQPEVRFAIERRHLTTHINSLEACCFWPAPVKANRTCARSVKSTVVQHRSKSHEAWTQIAAEVEALDPDRRCAAYWRGKRQREAAAAGLLPWRQRAPGDAASAPAERSCSGRNRRRYRAVPKRLVDCILDVRLAHMFAPKRCLSRRHGLKDISASLRPHA